MYTLIFYILGTIFFCEQRVPEKLPIVTKWKNENASDQLIFDSAKKKKKIHNSVKKLKKHGFSRIQQQSLEIFGIYLLVLLKSH